MDLSLRLWRHPRPQGAEGLCLGRTDLPVDPRRARRLAHRIRLWSRREAGLREVWTSPLQRCRAVGECLSSWGWRHHIDDRLRELDFGDWDGRAWGEIPIEAIDAWCADLRFHRPGGGESLDELAQRCAGFLAECGVQRRYVVTHGGWMTTAWHLAQGWPLPATAACWPAAPAYGRDMEVAQRAAGAAVLGEKSQ
jgi:alpha-ribazole phosphatase